MRGVRLAATLLALAGAASAHVGSPDVFFQGNAGPYPLLVTIRPPDVIPGVARIEVRSLRPGVERIELTPTPMTGPAATHPPIADVAQRVDSLGFRGLAVADERWIVGSAHSSQRSEGRGRDAGARAGGRTSDAAHEQGRELLPVRDDGTARGGHGRDRGSGRARGAARSGSHSEALESEDNGGDDMRVHSYGGALWSGNTWWGNDAATYSQRIYKPLGITASLNQPDLLQFQITDPGLAPTAPTRRSDSGSWPPDAPVSGAVARHGSDGSSASGSDRDGVLRDPAAFPSRRHLSPLCGHRARERFRRDSSGADDSAGSAG